MYLFVAWALHCWLRTIPQVGFIIAEQRLCTSQYADDSVALLESCSPYQRTAPARVVG